MLKVFCFRSGNDSNSKCCAFSTVIFGGVMTLLILKSVNVTVSRSVLLVGRKIDERY